MFKESDQIEKFEPKVWLSSPTMHGEEFEFLKEAYETNWMSTVGANINEVERLVCKKIGCKYAVGLSAGTAALHMAVKLAGVKPGEKVFCYLLIIRNKFMYDHFNHKRHTDCHSYIYDRMKLKNLAYEWHYQHAKDEEVNIPRIPIKIWTQCKKINNQTLYSEFPPSLHHSERNK